MSKYAKIEDGIVINTIECEDSVIASMPGLHIKVLESTRDANIGSSWDSENLKFIDKKPYESWTLNQEFEWVAPVEFPGPGNVWDEEEQVWINLKENN